MKYSTAYHMLPALRPGWVWVRYTKGDSAKTSWFPARRPSALSDVAEGWPTSGDFVMYSTGDDGLVPRLPWTLNKVLRIP